MAEPRATYRLQLRADFGFAHVAALAPYLAALGVSHVYLSPVLQAAPGSTHGYDVVDPATVSAELGGAAGFSAMVDALHAHGLGVLLDIVPNHMAITAGNAWWWDVLENGPASVYASYFDVDWDPPESKLRNRVLMPILGDHYGRVLEAGEIVLGRDGGRFVVSYHDHRLPVAPRSLDGLLGTAAAQAGSDELASMATAFGRLPPSTATDRTSVLERHRDKEVLAGRVAELCERDPALAKAIDLVVADWNGDPDALDALLDRQNYRLAFWRTAATDLDYRRFFDINELIGLRVEAPDVFDATHGRIARWLEEGAVDGVRVDHIDGLREPRAYLDRLARLAGRAHLDGRPADDGPGGGRPWIVVEKILGSDERLPADWPVDGTTGYEFAQAVLGVLVDPAGAGPLQRWYAELTGEDVGFEEVSRAARRFVMRTALAADERRITARFQRVCEANRRYRDYTRHELSDAIREVIVAFGVYRTYCDPRSDVSAEDRAVVHAAVDAAITRRPDIDPDLLNFLGRVLLLEQAGPDETEFALRFQQLTGPVMAKGVEDTAFYRYHRFVALNEVGGEPDRFGSTVDAFHCANALRGERWPRALVTTATHDTKRGEDVRARLAVLSEIPQDWAAAVARWERRAADAGVELDPNARALWWQTMVGSWPLPAERGRAYLLKAAREAKVHTSWTDPNPQYEDAVARFVAWACEARDLAADVGAFVATIDGAGRANALAQTVLKLTVPGVTDLYQGTELWDSSLVDPDNRRPVDYDKRASLLASGDHPKLATIATLLRLRRDRPDLLGPAAPYTPLAADGDAADHVVAFGRGSGLVVVVGRWRMKLASAGGWRRTTLTIPAEVFGGPPMVDVLTGTEHKGRVLDLDTVVGSRPAAVLVAAGSASHA